VSEPTAAPRFVPLAELLAVGRDPRSVVAFSRAGERTFGDFAGRVAALAEAIRARRAARWILFTEDSYAFAVGLFALAQTGGRALIAPNRQSQTLAELAVHAEGALVDPALGVDELARLPRLDPLAVSPVAGVTALRPLDPDQPLAELSTSGTTGPGKAVPKTLGHLDREVAVHETLFGAALGPGARMFATVSHQHLYGLLFRLLWPLASGRAFCSETFLHLEELFPRIRESGGCALATTPVHLRRMRADGELPSLRPALRMLFSSGGPLESDVARDVAERVGHAPIEIFGSTETGGVAWRAQQSAGDSTPWRAFPEVELALEPAEQRLVVRSPYVSHGSAAREGDWQQLVMGDRAELSPDGFRLLGRADRIVKIGEKRLALPEMESHLRAHPWVADAALLSFDNQGDARVGAVVALSDSGEAALAERGRRVLGSSLSEHLAGYWDRVLLPRAWRYVSELPRDAQGKTSRAALAALFEDGAERAPVLHAVLLSERRDASSLVRELRVPSDLAFLDGHFPGHPVVAGVVQIHWLMQAAREWLGPGFRARSLEGVRFRELLLPGQSFTLELTLAESGDSASFRLFDGARVFSSGRVVLR
jgi:acyl-CoA synthetase (AMP-forming)/AMP-acid ligase II